MSEPTETTQMHRVEDGRLGCSQFRRQADQGRAAELGMCPQRCFIVPLPANDNYQHYHYYDWVVAPTVGVLSSYDNYNDHHYILGFIEFVGLLL